VHCHFLKMTDKLKRVLNLESSMRDMSSHSGLSRVLALSSAWREEELTITLPAMGAFAQSPSLGNKLRGALGDVLLKSASSDVLDRAACRWSRPSTADIFYGVGEKIALGDHDSAIARPFVLFANEGRNHALDVRLRIFGDATARAEAVFDALIAAVCHKVDWQTMTRDGPRYLPSRIAPSNVKARSYTEGFKPESLSDEADMIFLAAIDADRGNPATDPSIVLARLVRRLALIAPWFSTSLAQEYQALMELAEQTHITIAEECSTPSPQLGGHHRANTLAPPMRFHLSNIPPAFRLPLLIGERIHIGRGASMGLGRYRLIAG
jgi:hypothetical protein